MAIQFCHFSNGQVLNRWRTWLCCFLFCCALLWSVRCVFFCFLFLLFTDWLAVLFLYFILFLSLYFTRLSSHTLFIITTRFVVVAFLVVFNPLLWLLNFSFTFTSVSCICAYIKLSTLITSFADSFHYNNNNCWGLTILMRFMHATNGRQVLDDNDDARCAPSECMNQHSSSLCAYTSNARWWQNDCVVVMMMMTMIKKK